MTQKEFIKLLERYCHGRCIWDEGNLVEKWCDTILENEEKPIEYSLEDRARMFNVIKASKGKEVAPRYPPFVSTAVSMAAVLVLVFGAAIYFTVFQKHSSPTASASPLKLTDAPVFNNSSKPVLVSLPDDTEVLLFPKSKLSAPLFSKAERNVRLEGKGFFKVTRNANRPFLVFTEKLVTKVLGTSFTVNATRGAEESVEVKTGKVAVYPTRPSAEKKQYPLPDFCVTITPNQQVRLDTVQHRLVKSLVAHPAPVQSPETKATSEAGASSPPLPMNFEGAPVIEIFKALEVSYGVEIKYDKDKISNCILTVSLEGEDLFMRLQVVCNAINGKYRIDETRVIISSPGCG